MKYVLSMLSIVMLIGCEKPDIIKPYYDHCIDSFSTLRKKGFFKDKNKKTICKCISHRQLQILAEEIKYTNLNLYSNINKEVKALKEQSFTVAVYDCKYKYK